MERVGSCLGGRRVWILLLVTAIAASVLSSAAARLAMRAGAYAVYRSFQRAALRWETRGMATLQGTHFTVYYDPADPAVARWVLDAAERVYDPVAERVGHAPPGPIPVVVHPDRASLQAAFGWGDHQSATGVYWAGVIRVLSPRVWLPDSDPALQAALFARLNPLAHELTHYALDYMTGGNYPRWYTEGLAQRIEAEVTGYRWLERKMSLEQGYYSLAELNAGFDSLPNQALAYRVSFLLVEYLAGVCGEDGLRRVNAALRWEPVLDRALEQQCQIPAGQLDRRFAAWVTQHMAELEADLPPA